MPWPSYVTLLSRVGVGASTVLTMDYGSAPPSYVFASSTFYPCNGIIWPLSTFVAASSATAIAATFSCLVVFYAVSRPTRISAITTSSLPFSTNYEMCSFIASFFLYAANFSIFVMSRAHHSSDHVSRMLNMTSSMAIKGSSPHYLVGSLWTLI